ncbi:AmmeMemoRadiSam system protein A [Candidatus Woesearchaeota archaeon]|nr:AmmeMemoRadiSam system protein A [Candidatus Woesearchaeota archaeon]
MTLTIEEKQFLLQLARKAIEHYLDSGSVLTIEDIENQSKLPESLTEEKGSFVTLTVHSALRGCIGHLLPVQALYKDVIDNALHAAFEDPRFPAMVKKELEDVTIEISVLDVPQKLDYKDENDLLNQLSKTKPGVIIKKGVQQATYLPQVWDDLPDVQEFLSSLCMKAGLNPKEWKSGIDIEVYGVDKFTEEN